MRGLRATATVASAGCAPAPAAAWGGIGSASGAGAQDVAVPAGGDAASVAARWPDGAGVPGPGPRGPAAGPRSPPLGSPPGSPPPDPPRSCRPRGPGRSPPGSDWPLGPGLGPRHRRPQDLPGCRPPGRGRSLQSARRRCVRSPRPGALESCRPPSPARGSGRRGPWSPASAPERCAACPPGRSWARSSSGQSPLASPAGPACARPPRGPPAPARRRPARTAAAPRSGLGGCPGSERRGWRGWPRSSACRPRAPHPLRGAGSSGAPAGRTRPPQRSTPIHQPGSARGGPFSAAASKRWPRAESGAQSRARAATQSLGSVPRRCNAECRSRSSTRAQARGSINARVGGSSSTSRGRPGRRPR